MPDGLEGRVAFGGAPVLIPATIVQPMALVLHELVPNAVRQGALGTLAGSLDVTWDRQDETFSLRWRERGTTGVTPPASPRVGLRVLEGVVKRQLGVSLAMARWRCGISAELFVPPASALESRLVRGRPVVTQQASAMPSVDDVCLETRYRLRDVLESQ